MFKKKREIEDVICELLTGDMQKNALDFTAHLRACGIPLTKTSQKSGDIIAAKYNGEDVCYIQVCGLDELPSHWMVWSDQVPGSWASWDNSACTVAPVDEQTKEVAWANVKICQGCGECGPGRRKTVLGKEFDNLCTSAMEFMNPDGAALDCVKKMVDARISDIQRT